MSSTASDLLEGIVSSTKASISVILVLLYGYAMRKWKLISQEGESNISRIDTTFFLPALLFTEIGPLATWDNLKKYWPIIPLSVCFQLIALTVALASRLLGMLPHYVPLFVFNNVTSLPLLLIEALAATGALDPLVMPGKTLDGALKNGRVYVLINALVGNLTRFALGPYLMKSHPSRNWFHSYHDDPHRNESPLPGMGEGQITLPYEEDPAPPTTKDRTLSGLKTAKEWTVGAMNPPLIGGLLAIFFGIIPWFHTQLFGSGFLSPIYNSISNVGKLFSALQMLVLGAHLYSKQGTKSKPFHLVWLFFYRFAIAPAISISVVYGIRTTWPDLLDNDPMLDFVIAMSNVGPPALTLAAIATMGHVGDEVEGEISRVLTLSYGVTPLISFPVSIAIWMVKQTDVGELEI
ncbi:hypothetical protein DFH07DRAFT_483 [Mycena maculata]|uniref:Auxin efflux carrier n=1 Tax=Mycena maculata TaxID=230809 RepID=A0AAD7KFX5_9AGAR|nr:hypothetical protein DFH07DRAFT_483 [Mycena maculata]